MWLAATLRKSSPKPNDTIQHTKYEYSLECRLGVDLNGLQQTGELRGSEGAAAENKALKKQMQWEENPSCLAAVSLCWDDKGIGKNDWRPSEPPHKLKYVHMHCINKKLRCGRAIEIKMTVILFFLLPQRKTRTKLRGVCFSQRCLILLQVYLKWKKSLFSKIH